MRAIFYGSACDSWQVTTICRVSQTSRSDSSQVSISRVFLSIHTDLIVHATTVLGKIMICSIYCRCSSETPSLASHWFYRQLHSPFFCECKVLGEARPHLSTEAAHQKLIFQRFGSRFYSCKLGGHEAVKFGLGRFFVWGTWPIELLERDSCILNTRASRLCKTQRMATGNGCGTYAAMEVNYATDSTKACCADKTIDSKSTANGTSSPPGFSCTSVTTVGKSTNIAWQECMVKKEERQKLLGQKGCVIWITGLSGSGKSTLACTLDHALLKRGNLSYVVDGDNVRHGLNNNLGFCAEDRAENIRRVGEVAKLFADAGVICIASVISPYRKDRDECRQLLHAGEFIEVHMNFPVSLCEERDPKGLYKLARAGKIKGFTGVDDPYEAPVNCEVVMQPIDGKCPTPEEMACRLISFLEEKHFLGPPR